MRPIVHIGAHRTATLSLQRMLRRKRRVLAKRGYNISTPDDNRTWLSAPMGQMLEGNEAHIQNAKREAEALLKQDAQLFLSDENIVGTMPPIVNAGRLYPNAGQRAKLITEIFGEVDILLVTRDYASFFKSVYRHRARIAPHKPFEEYKSRFLLARGWSDVVTDIIEAIGRAPRILAFENYQLDLLDFLRAIGLPDDIDFPKVHAHPGGRDIDANWSEGEQDELTARYTQELEQLKPYRIDVNR